MKIPTEPAHTLNGWTYRFHPAKVTPCRLLLMLHGWTGNENSMWFFTHNLPDHYAALLPRAPLVEPSGGYTWRQLPPGRRYLPGLEELRPATEALVHFLDEWSNASGISVDNFDVAGFSQGAAMAYTLALLHPLRVHRIAVLSGFLPEGWDQWRESMQGKQIFISHGREDEIVSVELARKARTLLVEAGADVLYCESDGGHKVGKDCLRGIETFYKTG